MIASMIFGEQFGKAPPTVPPGRLLRISATHRFQPPEQPQDILSRLAMLVFESGNAPPDLKRVAARAWKESHLQKLDLLTPLRQGAQPGVECDHSRLVPRGQRDEVGIVYLLVAQGLCYLCLLLFKNLFAPFCQSG